MRRTKWSVTIWKGGRYAQLLAPSRGAPRIPPKRRGTVGGFSRASRRRLFAFLFSLDQAAEGIPLFLTLTYPGAAKWNDFDRTTCKRDLDAFLKRLRRSCPAAHGVWKLEPQRRGAPHFHLLVFGTTFLPVAEVSRLWWEVVGSGDASNLKNGVDLRPARSWRGVAAYVSKYVAKTVEEVPPGWRTPGRWWGRFNRSAFKRECETIDVAPVAAERLRRVGSRAVFKKNRQAQLDYLSVPRTGLSVFCGEDVARRAIEWAARPRWRAGCVRPGGPAWYRRRAARHADGFVRGRGGPTKPVPIR